MALNAFDAALDGLINTIQAGALDHLSAAEKISFWQLFETSRNRLPLIDHVLIADAESTDLAGEYCFSKVTMLLTRRLQLSPAEAAARVRAINTAPAHNQHRRDGRVGAQIPKDLHQMDLPPVNPNGHRIFLRRLTS
ncbi:MAG TPA: hypothetical protein VJ301_16940 [Propionibacteriaceae bacterium]|nr:hypothetical protein [Propionibacteriaceae bacterium]